MHNDYFPGRMGHTWFINCLFFMKDRPQKWHVPVLRVIPEDAELDWLEIDNELDFLKMFSLDFGQNWHILLPFTCNTAWNIVGYECCQETSSYQ